MKLSIEKFFYQHGHSIQSWHTDNGRYAEEDFKEAVSSANQAITFCGVGAHHQNEIAEAAIKQSTLEVNPFAPCKKILAKHDNNNPLALCFVDSCKKHNL